MATSLVVGDILSLKAWNSLSPQAAVNTYNYEVINTAGGGVSDKDFVDHQASLFGTFYKGLMPGSATHNGLQLYFIKRAGFLPAPVSNTTQFGIGTKGTNACPKSAAPVLKFSTAIRGPAGRGRVFLPFPSLDWVAADGTPTNAFDVFVSSFASALLPPVVVTSGANTATLVLVIVKRPTPPALPTAVQVGNAAPADKFGVMHKRGDYGRANESPI